MRQIYLAFKNNTEFKIFFYLVNQKEPIERAIIAETLNIPRTTIYDNLVNLMNRKYYYRLLKVKSVNYVKKKKLYIGIGRPKITYYVPEKLRYLLTYEAITQITVNGKKLNLKQDD